ncbi:nitrogen assimilation transcription factor nit-4 [Aspergillus udagawae]|nr:nitrogen assimilation transcription factor nit-4 [Aspergillus udagawae]
MVDIAGQGRLLLLANSKAHYPEARIAVQGDRNPYSRTQSHVRMASLLGKTLFTTDYHLCPLQTTALLRPQYYREMLWEHIKVTPGFSVLSMTPLFPGRPHPHLERGDPQTG